MMSKLSELLNPAPNSQSSPPAPNASQLPHVTPLVLDGRDRHSSQRSSFSRGAGGSPTAYNTLTSPGLEALAAAASTTAPMLSPPQNQHTFAETTPYQQTYPHYSSRPSSSHTALPPLSNDFSHTLGHQSAPYSAGLEQYHIHSSSERRLSNSAADHSARLPPFQRSPPNHSLSFPTKVNGGHQPIEAPEDGNGEEIRQLTLSPSDLQKPLTGHNGDHKSDAPATSQIRQPSPGPSQSFAATALPGSQSEQVQVKAEMTEDLVTMSQNASQFDGPGAERPAKISTPILKNITEIKKDSSHTPSPMPAEKSSTPSAKPKAPPSKKRAGPKKGTASTVKPPAKKRKIDTDSVDGTAPGQRKGSPATSRASMTPAPKNPNRKQDSITPVRSSPVPKNRKQGSATPARSSSVVNGDDEDDDDSQVFCICRKPDDHGLMIGCDGPCQDWFHAKCVDLDHGKSELVNKWYCPNCTELGNETLWKRMCRLEGCNKPAREEPETGYKSKYCSDEHGEEFMRRRLPGHSSDQKKATSKKRRQENYTENIGNTGDDPSDDDDRAHLRGGILKAAEVKTLIDGSKDLDAFRTLGDGVLSPPPTVSPEGDDVKMEDAKGVQREKVTYTPEESTQLEEIAVKREQARARKKMLDDRDKLLSRIITRKEVVLSELREKDKAFKDICGYDTRLVWADQQFNEWRASPEGRTALQEGGTLGPPAPVEKSRDPLKMEDGEEVKTSESNQGGAEEAEEEEIGRGVCKKKRCERHRAWLKLQTQDNAFEKDQVRQEMRKLEAEEKGLKDRATIRSLEVKQDAG